MFTRDAKVMFNLSSADPTIENEEEEIKSLIETDQESITDVDISENSKQVLTFTKRPWTEWVCGTMFIVLPLLVLPFLPAEYFQGIK
jgi:hypothetical protein